MSFSADLCPQHDGEVPWGSLLWVVTRYLSSVVRCQTSPSVFIGLVRRSFNAQYSTSFNAQRVHEALWFETSIHSPDLN